MSNEKPEKVKVRIVAEETIKYHQVVEMSRDEFEKLSAEWEAVCTRRERESIDDVISMWLDRSDVFDADDFEVEEFELQEESEGDGEEI